MSILTITNAIKSPYGCGNYYVSITNAGPQGSLDISFIDCTGVQRNYSIEDDGSNQATIDDTICAQKDTIVTNGVYTLLGELECTIPINGGSYQVLDNTFVCSGRGDGPTNFDCECSGHPGFNISQLTGVNSGIIQFVSWSTPSNSYLQVNGVQSNTGDIFNINDILSSPISYMNLGNPVEYPNCQSNYSTDFVFKHSLDGGVTWGQPFTITVSGQYP